MGSAALQQLRQLALRELRLARIWSFKVGVRPHPRAVAELVAFRFCRTWALGLRAAAGFHASGPEAIQSKTLTPEY